MRSVVLIHNPSAARHRQSVVETINRVLLGQGCTIELVATRRPGHARDVSADAARRGVDVVAVYGGDGTMIQAVEGIVGTDVLLGLVRGGTGNLLAGNLKLPRDPVRAALVIANGIPRQIDLGHLVTSEGGRHFAVACGAGFDAEVMAATTSAAKRRLRMLAYVFRILGLAHRIKATSHAVVVDGVSHVVEASTILVANCPAIIPGLLDFGKQVAFDDGQLDLVALNANGIPSAVAAMWGLFRGQQNQRVTRFRGREIRIEPLAPRRVQLDGEEAGFTPITASVIPGGLRVLVPDPAL
jgi:diacylglycerol kinase family enzyme